MMYLDLRSEHLIATPPLFDEALERNASEIQKNSLQPAPKKVKSKPSTSSSLVVRLRWKSNDLVGLADNQAIAFSSFPRAKVPTKRQRNAQANYSALDPGLAFEEHPSQRLRLTESPRASAPWAPAYPYQHSQHAAVNFSLTGRVYTQPIIHLLDSMSLPLQLPVNTQYALDSSQGFHGPILPPSPLHPLQFLPFLQSPHVQPPLTHGLSKIQTNITSYLWQGSAPISHSIAPEELDKQTFGSVLYAILTKSRRTFPSRKHPHSALIEPSLMPEPTSHPEVWAKTRADLCETLPYFRSFKSASHTVDNFAKGFMFSDNARPRDFTDASVVLSHAGGGLVFDRETRTMKQGGDQIEHSSIRCLGNNMAQYNPVDLITSHSNLCMPSKPPHKFCVLGWFKPAHI
ncbi:hypothetical protein K458DRAFT_427982 [Lentithecium fluviatile CBS 122367]|uniref:Uncharacterized protein n=1 Tax=Lentithecium fluviatile CBS 122367 TaxID=1168545 RepID=A0A6G1JDT6_9PLEO|nr:hypothetical protein K458DRAFT_427982 [Lentithecium fluviatile CBS 122367]